MKIRLSRRIIAMALAFVMVLGFVPATAFARTAGKDGSAEMNEDYAAKESLMPVGPSFSTYTLLEWTVESDPDAVYSRASIPLTDRVGGFVVNPLANPEAKLMLCSLANSDHDHTSAQGTESFLSYSFNYWQYVDSFVYWSGSQEGLICCPTGEFIDAAHTNGVPVVATLGFPWGSGAGYVQEVVDFCQKAEDGTFPVADKLIEVMDYYGFDGYFFNQESYGCNAATAKLLDEMIHYMHAKRPGMLISWYDSMTEGGGVNYGNAVNESNKFWMKDDADGNRGVDEFFMNYNWFDSQITGTISAMRSIGRSEFDAFAGIDVQQNCMDTPFRDHLLVDEDGVARLSLALYCPNSTLGLSPDGAAFHEVERTFYTNAVEDPRDTSIDITSASEDDWAGMSRLFADKTPITSAPFVTDFNSGHGLGYWVDGVLSRDAEWSYQSNQDVMPTWTWIIDSEGTKLSGDYDFTDAYNGGNSIKFHGTLNAVNDILIYSTDIAVESGMTLALTAKGGLENASLVAYMDDGSAASYADCEQVVTALAAGEGWVETVADLSAHAGKTLKAIGLKVEGSVSDYQINLGRITVLDRARNALNGPASITLDEIMYTDAYTAEVRMQWAKVTGASSYEIYKVHVDGSRTLIMATPSTAFYIPALKRAADETDVTVEIVPINRSGVRGKGTTLTIDWAYGNDDSDEVVQQVFENVALNATVTGVSAENSGEPAYKALDGTSANNSKWCATNYGSGWMSIDIGREVTVKRWRVEHAEYGGEANNMNTIDFALEYKDKDSNSWVQVKRIRNNHDAVTDVLLDTPITASEWKLQVYDDGNSPWGGIRIYEWQMFETDQFPQTDVVPMHFASAVNGVGASDTFTLKNVPTGVTVKVYDEAGNLLGEATPVNNVVTLTDLDFGTADAGKVYYTTTTTAAAESARLSARFEAEDAEKSAPAGDVEFVAYSHPGSVTSANGNDIYTTLTVNGLNPGDVVYVYENGADAEATKVSLPVAEGETSVSVNRVLVPRAGGTLELRVKRVGCLISDVYTVSSPSFGVPTASLRVYAKNARGESLTGVRFAVIDAAGNEVAQLSTTSDSGAVCTAGLGTYRIRCMEVPTGYDKPSETPEVNLAIEGWEYTVEVTIPDHEGTEVPESGLLSANAEIIAYNGTMLGDIAGPEKLFDGGKTDPNSHKWCESGKDLWVAFDLGAAANVGSISIYHAGAADEWEPSPDTINTEAYELYVLNTDVVDVDELLAMSFDERTALLADNANWTELAAVTGNHDDITTHELALSGVRIFKFNVSDTDSINTWGDCVRVYEIEVMGEDVGAYDEALKQARAAAEAAQAAADEAKAAAEAAQAAADEAAASTAENKEAAEAAQAAADEAKAAAEAAQAAADAAQAALEAVEAGDPAAVEEAKHAQLIAELYAELAETKAEMAEHLRDAQKAAEEEEAYREAIEAAELAKAKYEALMELTEYADASNADQAALEAIVNEAIEAIRAAETVEAVEEALTEALDAIDALAGGLPFVDVPVTSFYYDAVKWAVENDITTGTSATTFSPDKNVTRAEAVTFLWRAAGEPEPTTTVTPFTDVSEGAFYYKAMLWAVEEGITTGLTETTFGPAATANRAQIVTFLWRTMDKPVVGTENPFADVAEGSWYYDAVLWAVSEGITTGLTANTFGSEGLCNRAQMVTFLYRAFA